MAFHFSRFLLTSLLLLQMCCVQPGLNMRKLLSASTSTASMATPNAIMPSNNVSSDNTYVCNMTAPLNASEIESFDYSQAGWTLVLSLLTFLLSLIALPLVINCRVLQGHYLENIAVQIIFVGWAKTVLITPFLVTALIFRMWFAPEYYCHLIGYWYESLTVFRVFITPGILVSPIINAMASNTVTSYFVNLHIIFAWLVAAIYGLTATLSYFTCYTYFPTLKLCSIFTDCSPLCEYNTYIWTFVVFGYGIVLPVIIYTCLCNNLASVEAAVLRQMDEEDEAEDAEEERQRREREREDDNDNGGDEGDNMREEPAQRDVEMVDNAQQVGESMTQGSAKKEKKAEGQDKEKGAGNEKTKSEDDEECETDQPVERPWLIVFFSALLAVPSIFFYMFQRPPPSQNTAIYVYQTVFGYPIFFLVPILDMIALLTIPGVFGRVLEALKMCNITFGFILAPCTLLLHIIIAILCRARCLDPAKADEAAEENIREDAITDTATVFQDTRIVPKQTPSTVEYIQMQTLSPVVAMPAINDPEGIATTAIEAPKAVFSMIETDLAKMDTDEADPAE